MSGFTPGSSTYPGAALYPDRVAEDVSATPVQGGTAVTVQGVLDELAARVAALEVP